MFGPDPGCRYRFPLGELDAALDCLDAHGFAVITRLIAPACADALRSEALTALDPTKEMEAGQERSNTNYVEAAPALMSLFTDEGFIGLLARLVGSERFTINRSAAILRAPGNRGIYWHADRFGGGEALTAADILGDNDYPAGIWFYLNGSSPARGGLAVIADSHRADWQAPSGFVLSSDRQAILRVGAESDPYTGMDVPGMVSVISDPEDAVIFASRTYHASHPYPSDRPEPRTTVGLSVRPCSHRLRADWPLSPSAARFVAGAPAWMRPYLEGYLNYDPQWRRTQVART